MCKRSRSRKWTLLLVFILAVAGCGGDGSDDNEATPTATRQSTPLATATTAPTVTRTPVEGSLVSGLVVVNASVSTRGNENLGLPPAEWTDDAKNASFDTALGFADWTVVENENVTGTTSADGRFEITDLARGRYTLAITKSIGGNLLNATVPFSVGDDGATVVAEMSWGLVRSVSTYDDNGVVVREVRSPWGHWLITRDGKIAELGDPSITISDPDGDGSFDVVPCVETLWRCDGDRSCGDDRVCACVPSCPFCEDCGAVACQAPGQTGLAYRCDQGGTCQQPGDRCVCISSCPDCDDCVSSACVPGCSSVEISALTVSGIAQLIRGEHGQVNAVIRLSTGRLVDATSLVDWSSANLDVATVDSFGSVTAQGIGTATISATLGDVESNDFTLTVTDRPPLSHIYLQNVNCYYPLGDPRTAPGDRPPVLAAPPIQDAIWWPSCNQVLRIGGTIQFRAMGEFGTGQYYLDITDEVTWQLSAPSVGTISGGLFTAQAEGTTELTASLDGVSSDASPIRVVTKATVTMLSIYPGQNGPIFFDGPPVSPDRDGQAAEIAYPCFECGYTIPVLRGDELNFHATAHYDTGEWTDVTASASWRSSDTSVATIDSDGTMLAIVAGTAIIDATFESVASNKVTAQVVNEATLQYLYLQVEGTDRVVAKGGQVFIHALGTYDLGFQRDVSDDVEWHSSNDAVGTVDEHGVFSARAVGTVQLWAQSGELRSETLNLEVYETSDVTYCDANDINRGMWSDDFNRVTLESDCKTYTRPSVVTLRYTVTETQPHGGIFDPCLDLYVYQGTTRVRTLREEGCGEPFLPNAAPGYEDAALKYQLRAFWDLKDESGQPVGPGTYTVFGRFYLYYDPVVSIDVEVE